jgi:hypothetical protein
MHFIQRHIILLTLLLSVTISNAQINDSSINVFQIRAGYSLHLLSGDIGERFGISNMIGGGLENKFSNNWSLGIEYNYMFGGFVKEDSILNHLTDKEDGIINQYGEYGTVLLTQRGFYIGAYAGKIIPVFKSNPNSGLKLEFGAGLLQHHIHIENKDNNIPAVLGDYRDGYDRLTNGLSLRQFIGYQNIDPKGYFNFELGFECFQAWTYNRRSINYDTGLADTELKHDYLWGIHFVWFFPIYQKSPDEFYYF